MSGLVEYSLPAATYTCLERPPGNSFFTIIYFVNCEVLTLQQLAHLFDFTRFRLSSLTYSLDVSFHLLHAAVFSRVIFMARMRRTKAADTAEASQILH